MNVVIVIDGREAIPVRAIPLLTNWETMSPDVVAHVFARDEMYYKFSGLHAFRIEGEITKRIDATWWENFPCVELDSLHHKLKRQEASGLISMQEGYRQWQIDSLPLLPAGAFVWKDEFEPLHVKRFGVDGMTYMTDKTESKLVPDDVQREKVRLNYDPFISNFETKRLILEGFLSPDATSEHNLPSIDPPPTKEAEPSSAVKEQAVVAQADTVKPWLADSPQDPIPLHHWYTPARYFARQLIVGDSTLLTKRLILASKVATSLEKVGIFKRGGKRPLSAETVLKAFANVKLG